CLSGGAVLCDYSIPASRSQLHLAINCARRGGNLLTETIAAGFAWRYEELGSKVAELATPLGEKQFWTKPFGFGNSFGHLVLHLTGNLNYYIGTEIAGTGYLSDRDREFTEASQPSKDEVLKRFSDAVAVVARTARARWEEAGAGQ